LKQRVLTYDRSLDLDHRVDTPRGDLGQEVARAGNVPSNWWRGPGIVASEVGPDFVHFDIPPLVRRRPRRSFRGVVDEPGRAARISVGPVAAADVVSRQTKFLRLIPLGPKRQLAMKPYRMSLESILAELREMDSGAVMQPGSEGRLTPVSSVLGVADIESSGEEAPWWNGITPS
jgi:hypothetical protein